MEAAHHVADDLRALPVLGVGGQPLLPHRVEDAALHRLQPVAHVGQRARGDDRERVVQISRLRRLVQRHGTVAAAAVPGRPSLGRRIEVKGVGGFFALRHSDSVSHRNDAGTQRNSSGIAASCTSWTLRLQDSRTLGLSAYSPTVTTFRMLRCASSTSWPSFLLR